jgi:hypothetical protein
MCMCALCVCVCACANGSSPVNKQRIITSGSSFLDLKEISDELVAQVLPMPYTLNPLPSTLNPAP